MSGFDSILDEFKTATADDIHIYVPGVVGGDKSAPAGNPGTSSANAGGSSAAHAGNAPEPAPELPEGSDPDDPAAVDEPEEEDVTPVEPDPEPELSDTTTTEDFPDPEPIQLGVDQTPSPEFPVIDRKNAALNFGGDSCTLRQFPKGLVETMRELLIPSLGKTFATDLSQNSVVVAFVIASLGTDLDTDANTAHAVKAFRETDPKTDLVDKRTRELLQQQVKVEAVLKTLTKHIGAMASTTSVLEMGQAYLLADRTAQIDSAGITPETIDITQKRVVAARDNVRTRVGKLDREETIRAGRPVR